MTNSVVMMFGWGIRQWGIIATLMTLLATLPVIVYGSRFYYIDDSQAVFMPVFLEMGRQIAHGSFPFMTLKSWAAGAIAAEYYSCTFNPIILAFSTIFYLFIDKFSHAAALFSIFHLVFFGLGVFAICGSLRCRMPEAAFAAIVAGTGIWLIYFAAMSWVGTLASIAWFAWTIAALLRLEHEQRWLIPSALLIALTITSGTPHTDVALAVFVVIYLLRILAETGWRACLIPLLAAIAGGLLAAPSLLPLVVYHAFSTRPPTFPKLQWMVPLYAFFSLGLPIFAAPWYTWIYEPWYDWLKWGVYGFPIVYLDWVVPIILVKAWRDERQVFRDKHVRFLGWLTLAFFALCMMPNVATIRWPFRFLPYFHLFLILMVARILTVFRSDGLQGLKWDWRLIATAVGLPVAVAAAFASLFRPALHGPLAPGKLLLIVLFTGLGVALFALTKARQPERRIKMLAAGHALTFLGMILAYPTNPGLPRWHMPTFRNAPSDGVFSGGNTLFLYYIYDYINDRLPWLFRASSQLYLGKNAINGASPLGPIAVQQFFAFQDHGSSVRNPLPRLFSKDPATGATYADLMRIDSIVAEKGRWATAAERAVPDTWPRRVLDHGEGMLFRRPSPKHPLPGTLSYRPEGVTARLVSFRDRVEKYELSVSRDYRGQPLVFARAWYPGYQIRLDGRSVKYRLAGDILPELVLPAGFSGRLTIDYLPAGFRTGCLLAAIAALALLIAAFQQHLIRFVAGTRYVASLLRERRWTSRS